LGTGRALAGIQGRARRQSLAGAGSGHPAEDQDYIGAIPDPRSSMRRGDIWTVAVGKSYAGMPQPAAILRDDRFDATVSIRLCVFTSDLTNGPLFRVLLEPNRNNCCGGQSTI
jgi:hypothetical protein